MDRHYICIVLAHTVRGVLLDDILRDVDVLGAVQSGRQQGSAQVHLHLNIFYRIEINMQNDITRILVHTSREFSILAAIVKSY